MATTKLIVGLGNPGKEYEGTRHNVGFQVADLLAKRWGAEYKRRRRLAADVAEANRAETRCVIARPLTFMNLSGQAVAALQRWLGCGPGDMLVVYDDADLALGQIRVRGSGSSGGHRGMQSVMEAIGSTAIARVRLGIGRSGETAGGLTDHVLSRFDRAELPVAQQMVARAADAVESWLARGLTATMNDFNKRTKEAA